MHYKYSQLIIKKHNTLNNSNTNYRSEIKLVPINMNYCIVYFDALKFSLGVRLQGGSLPNFNFFFQRKHPNLATKS